MKIGLVLPGLPTYSETFFRNKILSLQRSGYEVILFVNNANSENSFLGCKVIKAPRLNGNKFIVIKNSLAQLIKAIFLNPRKSFKLYNLNKIDKLSNFQNLKQVIINQFLMTDELDWLHFGFGTMALGRENLAQVIGARMAVSFRGFDIGIYPKSNPGCYKLLYRKVDKIHVISDDIKELLIKDGLSSKKNIIKITPAIDSDFFQNKEKRQNQVLQFSTVARLHWKKGLEYTLEALAFLKKSGVNFHYTIIGEGNEKERLLFAIHQLDLVNNVAFAGKLMPHEVKKQLEQTDVYLQYSLQEGFCNAVLEAQAMGLLCVVSDAEGLSENVLDEITGFVVKKQNSHLLFEKMKEVITLPESKKEELQKNAKLRVQQQFNLKKQQKEFLEFYS